MREFKFYLDKRGKISPENEAKWGQYWEDEKKKWMKEGFSNGTHYMYLSQWKSKH